MVLTDSGFWFALIDRHDRHHQRARIVYREVEEELAVTWPIVTETCHLLATRLGIKAQLGFMGSLIAEELVLLDLSVEDARRMRDLMRRYAELPMDLADASLVAAAERLGHGRILSTDERDFAAYRWKNHKPFQNLLLA